MKKLTKKEKQRYSRQIVFKEIGIKGQKKLKKSRIAILGLGGIGSAAAVYLARAGVGYIKLIDRDFTELSNIQRQILCDEKDYKEYKPKVIAAKEKLEKANSNIILKAIFEDFHPKTAEKLLKDVGLVIDATDNMETRYLLNEVCVKHKIPFIYGAAIKNQGMISLIIPGKTPCFKCMFPKKPKPGRLPTCESVGVLNPSPGIIGILEANEAIKYLVGFGQSLKSKLLYISLNLNKFELINVKKNPCCEVCVKKQFPLLKGKTKKEIISGLCGRNSVQVIPNQHLNINLNELSKKLSKNPEFEVIKKNPYLLAIHYGKSEILISPSGRAIIKNTTSKKEAKSILNKIISF